MNNDLSMSAYYYFFDNTGIYEIDVILSAIARAGKLYHGTENWNEEVEAEDPFEGKTPIEWIQNAANKAAKAWNEKLKTNGESGAVSKNNGTNSAL